MQTLTRECTCPRKVRREGDGKKHRWECCLEPTYRDALIGKHGKVVGKGQSGVVMAYNGRVYKTLLLDSRDARKDYLAEVNYSKLYAAEDIGPEVISMFIDESTQVGVIEMKQYEHSARNYFLKVLDSKPKEASKKYQARLKQIIRAMVRAQSYCIDLRPENFVVNVDHATKEITDMRIIDFGGGFCKTTKVGDQLPAYVVYVAMCTLCRWHTWHLTRNNERKGVDVLPKFETTPEAATYLMKADSFAPYLMGYYAAVGDGEDGPDIESSSKRRSELEAAMMWVLQLIADGETELPLKRWGKIEDAYKKYIAESV